MRSARDQLNAHTPPIVEQMEEPMALYTNGTAPFNPAAITNESNNGGTKKYRSRRRRFRGGQSVAALHALLAARAYAAGWFNTLTDAAVSAGASVDYTRAALVLLKNGNDDLIHHVLQGQVTFLSAAAQVAPQVRMIEAFKKASPENLKAVYAATGMTSDLGEHILHSSAEKQIAAARKVGVDVLWDGMIAPVITAAE
jgi:hypothetical protein